MSQGGYVTLVGFVAQDPQQRETKNGSRVTDLRVGATTRVQDRVTGQWRDGVTSYYDVSCWRRLGDHVRASLHKGDPVMIKGRFRSRTFTDKAGVSRTVIDIMADTVGHDLNRGIANYMRLMAETVGVAARIIDMPADLPAHMRSPIVHWLEASRGSMVFDIGKIRRDLGWEPQLGLAESLADSYRWFCAGGRAHYTYDFAPDEEILAEIARRGGPGQPPESARTVLRPQLNSLENL